MAQQFATAQQLFALSCELRREITRAAATSHHHPDFTDFLCQALEPCRACVQDLYDKQKTLESHMRQMHVQILAQQQTLQVHELRLRTLEEKAPITMEQRQKTLEEQDLKQRKMNEDLDVELSNSFLSKSHEASQTSIMTDEQVKFEKPEVKVEMVQDLQQHNKEGGIATTDSSLEGKDDAKKEGQRNVHEEWNPMFEFSESVYDAILFIGLDVLTVYSSTCMVLAFLLNSAMQWGVIVIMSRFFGEQLFPPDDRDRYQYWRAAEGHSYLNVDPLTGMSLISRVCAGDPGLPISASQMLTEEGIDEYLSKNGYFLCNLAIMLWTFCCFLELKGSLQLVMAFFVMPKSHSTKIAQDDGETVTLVAVTYRRYFLSSCVALIRGASAGFLLYYGTKWLAYTGDVIDLLLNASALGFVLDIDETIFGVMLSARVHGLFLQMQPIPLPASSLLNEFLPIVSIIAVGLFMLFVNFEYIQPNQADMELVTQILCGADSNVNVISGINALGWLVYASSVPFQEERSPEGVAAARVDVMGKLIANDPQVSMYGIDVAGPILQKNFENIRLSVNRPLFELAEMKGCVDWSKDQGGSFGGLLYVASGSERFKNFESCDQVQEYCRGEALDILAQNARYLCPITYGCADPISGLWDLGHTTAGCPSQCRKLLRKSKEIACQDSDGKQLNSSNSSNWLFMLGRMEQEGAIDELLAGKLRNMGCEALLSVSNDLRKRLCAHEFLYGGAGMMCPFSCGCLRYSKPYIEFGPQIDTLCPQSCENIESCLNSKGPLAGFECPKSCHHFPPLDGWDCPQSCDETGNSVKEYRGCLNVTDNGYTCQWWTSQTPNQHSYRPQNGNGLGFHNYCRGVGDSYLWCYIDDPDAPVRYDSCTVPF